MRLVRFHNDAVAGKWRADGTFAYAARFTIAGSTMIRSSR